MKKFKCIVAFAATVMALNSSTIVFAATQSGEANGTGTYEGNVSNAVFSVLVPTIPIEAETHHSTALDFILDPNDLIVKTNALKYKTQDNNEYVTFSGDKGFYFKNKDNNYSATSDTMTAKNKGINKIDVNVTATLSDYSNIALINSDPTKATNDEIFGENNQNAALCITLNKIVDNGDSVKSAITTTAAQIGGVVDGVNGDAFTYTWAAGENGGYSSTIDPNYDDFDEYSFNFTGAANKNGNWATDLDLGTPKLNVVWEFSEHVGNTNPSIADETLSISTTDNTVLTLNYGSGDSAATGVSKIEILGTANNAVNNTDITSKATYLTLNAENKTITFLPGFYTAMNNAGVTAGTIRVTFNNTLTATTNPDDAASGTGATTDSFTFTFS